jgi:DNA-binding response OmpR family regulator
MLMGFGAAHIQRRVSAEEAMAIVDVESFDLCLVDVRLSDSDGYALIRDLRRHAKDFVKFLPVVLICGHVRKSDLNKARDCGASYVITKPLSSRVLFDRVFWLARDRRTFVECPTYVGPDRRFKAFGPPPGEQGRRHDDLSADVGEAKEANMSQDAIDGFFDAKKVSV